jgi:hypothetical protein
MRTNSLIILTLIIIFSSCDPADNRFKVLNNSNTNIHVYYSCDSTMSDLQLFRTGYYKNANGDSSYTESSNYVLMDSSKNFPMRLGNSAWIKYLKSCASETLYVFFLTDSILDNYSDEEIKAESMFIKKDNYSLDELKDLDWTIIFQ